ncbi:myosin-like coiled-coil protein-domain-containing protein [Gamsiella multidivaricata]|uniref:myosin-like coiled-coil protein-domain-containing protein n=1 Tax=Gamsiella multidivaricata TaxID=101098 RepID=UPI00221E5354|nr:myosin-like coiled-coil protein-domain-containing protein [Gamsiella multidivaricata]KAI7828603.1 myosin-like coiled-coil protein-domain-containing protein [Gamsiella multidivaricata]
MVNFMQRKYLEMFQDMRKQERDQSRMKKKCELLQREKDLLQREKDRLQKSSDVLIAERSQLLEERQADKMNLAKSTSLNHKLEELCRRLHRDNRRIKAEVQQRTDQISGSFEKAISEFKDKMEHDIAERQRLVEENDSLLRDKFQGFLEQYDVREKHFNSVVKSKDLELQLAQAKLEQQQQQKRQETQKVELLKSQLNAFTKTEAELRKQLNVYVEKFKQVEETLNKSNSLFQTFRREMEAMSKKGANLERVNQTIRAKCDTMNRNILEMAEERTKHQQALDAANKKLIKLETLCRALHTERTMLRKNLDLYEARYPDFSLPTSTTAATPENEGCGEDKTPTDDTLPRTEKDGTNDSSLSSLRVAIGSVTLSPAGITTLTGNLSAIGATVTGSSLSVQNGGVKQSKVGGRRASVTFGRLRQKQKRQHMHMLLQRCEQSSSLADVVTAKQQMERLTLIETQRQADKTRKHGQDGEVGKSTCNTSMVQEIVDY